MSGTRRRRIRYVPLHGIERGDFDSDPSLGSDDEHIVLHSYRPPHAMSHLFGNLVVHVIDLWQNHVGEEDQSRREIHMEARPKRKKKLKDMGGLKFRP